MNDAVANSYSSNRHIGIIPTLIELQAQQTSSGKLTVLEALSKVGFVFKRIYILSHVAEGRTRGHHAHKNLRQVVIPLGGAFKIKLKANNQVHDFVLRPEDNKALLVPPGFWRELYDFSPGAVCVVAASEEYDEADYIRDYEEFVAWEQSRG